EGTAPRHSDHRLPQRRLRKNLLPGRRAARGGGPAPSVRTLPAGTPLHGRGSGACGGPGNRRRPRRIGDGRKRERAGKGQVRSRALPAESIEMATILILEDEADLGELYR